MDELKQALADAEQALIVATEDHAATEQAYYASLMRQAQAQDAVEAAKSALIAAVTEG
jgi:hypothetical protein